MSSHRTSDLECFKEAIWQEWTDQSIVAAWRKWHPKHAAFTSAATDAILEVGQIKPSMRVLDLASGSGDPALTLAEFVESEGHVTATDLGPGMLAVAQENARKAGLTNISFQQADAHSLPFPERHFDVVTCRFGVFYFADSIEALREILRVLKPGGRVVFIAHGPLEQSLFFSTALSPFLKRTEVPAPPPGAPHPFKFSESGLLPEELRRAGFQQVQEEFRTLAWAWSGTPEEFWRYLYEIAGPFHAIIDTLTPEQRGQAVCEAITGISQYYDGKHVNFSGEIIVASGVR